ncbi:hypothetical protein PAXRUDRAFT_14169 [Paxillus rubicundulus Ve08.2h10]|uniref:Uncharacterized protein n=1 Tax=Paxillus rubicundulus Ve08.2h10 TaxID=930991 RepID=A0A0D0D2P2_9AGAM|nr:hypothetical protein PAXRUDRAFT_14169 [Paxillus rubicundulus Ve08.2h10]
MSSVSSGMPFSSESTSNSPTAATSTSKCSKTVVPMRKSIKDVLHKGVAAMDDDKAHSSSFKLQKLHLKFDHTHFTEESGPGTQMFLAQAELLRLQQGMAKGQE